MILSIIAAVGDDGAIGIDGKLPWDIPSDLKRFKQLTTGHPIIMGRKTFESIGRALPGRTNIVVTSRDIDVTNITVARTLVEALDLAGRSPGSDEIFIIGGERLYAAALPIVDRIYMTQVMQKTPDADAFFPYWPVDQFETVSTDAIGLHGSEPANVFKLLQRLDAYLVLTPEEEAACEAGMLKMGFTKTEDGTDDQ